MIDSPTYISYKNDWLLGEISRALEEFIESADSFCSKRVNTLVIKFMAGWMTRLFRRLLYIPDPSKILRPDVEQLVEKWDCKGMTGEIHYPSQVREL